MRSGDFLPLTAAIGILRGERHAAKELQRQGCSPAQARRILYTGHIPSGLRPGVVHVLRTLRDRNAQRLAELDQEIAKLELEAAGKAARAGDPPGLGRGA